jgi:hypothetical protein
MENALGAGALAKVVVFRPEQARPRAAATPASLFPGAASHDVQLLPVDIVLLRRCMPMAGQKGTSAAVCR